MALNEVHHRDVQYLDSLNTFTRRESFHYFDDEKVGKGDKEWTYIKEHQQSTLCGSPIHVYLIVIMLK